MKRIKKGDTLIVSEISRLGRRLMEVMSIINELKPLSVKRHKASVPPTRTASSALQAAGRTGFNEDKNSFYPTPLTELNANDALK